MNKENLSLWQLVEKTDPRHTKKARIGQMNITAICPQYQRMKATEVFGPFGKGWGVKDPNYSFMDFPDSTKLCTYSATFWYILDEKLCEFPIQSNTKVAFVTQGGKGYLKIDDEYAKKAATDALTKGLSMLGFNSDVFLGKYDDNKYVNQVAQEFSQKLPPLQQPKFTQPQKPEQPQVELITAEQAAMLREVALGKDRKKVVDMLDGFGVKKFEQLPAAYLNGVKKTMGIK
jgi:hypothetical protein